MASVDIQSTTVHYEIYSVVYTQHMDGGYG